jgi:hypothetical protein
MDIAIEKIMPRDNDDSSVMNVVVRFWIPEKEGRSNSIEFTIFIDKSITSLEVIRRQALDQSYQLAEKLLASRP